MVCIEGHKKIVELLLEHDGVDVNVTDKIGVRDIRVTKLLLYRR